MGRYLQASTFTISVKIDGVCDQPIVRCSPSWNTEGGIFPPTARMATNLRPKTLVYGEIARAIPTFAVVWCAIESEHA